MLSCGRGLPSKQGPIHFKSEQAQTAAWLVFFVDLYPRADLLASIFALFLPSWLFRPNRNIYYLKKNAAGTWKSGTILSDNSAQVIQFIEDKDVRSALISNQHSLVFSSWIDL